MKFPISYFKQNKKGASKARNLGIRKAKGELIAFTDDDCIVDKKWLKNSCFDFTEDKSLVAVYGKVLPYLPANNPGLFCPSVTNFIKKKILFSSPCKNITFGFFSNNLIFRKEILKELGGFKEWLGVGSIGMSTEDEDIIYRILKKGKKVLIDPSVKVYHNRWLTEKNYYNQIDKYSSGYFSAFEYYHFEGNKEVNEYLITFWKNKIKEWKKEISFCFKDRYFKYLSRYIFFEIPIDIYYPVRGIFVAFFVKYIKEPIEKKWPRKF